MTQDQQDPGRSKLRGGEPRLSLHVTENEGGSASSYGGVGAMLREQRERSGESLEEASQRLRIRFPHLQAIEQGRFDDLPGRIYAIGFVRTYAEYLGLDAAATIELYKQETAGEEHSPKLVFPTPTAESRMPKVWLVAVSVLAAVVVYGGWHMTQDSGRAVVETVPPVPDQLIAQGGDGSARPAADSASAAPTPAQNKPASVENKPAAVERDEKPKEEPKPVVAAAEPEREEQVAAAPVNDDAPVQPTTAEPEADETEPPAAETTQLEEPDPAPPAQQDAEPEQAPADAADAEATVETQTAAAEPDEEDTGAADNRRVNVPITRFTDTSDVVQTDRREWAEPHQQRRAEPAEEEDQVAAVSPSPTPTRTTPPPLPPSAEAADGAASESDGLDANGYVPRVFGGGSGGRVIVTATMDSWVQVRSGDNELLLTRILRAGDRYQAPDRPDLVLMTGNAGGLEIRVDGKLVPPIGPVGEVRRDVSLEAASLLERTSSN